MELISTKLAPVNRLASPAWVKGYRGKEEIIREYPSVELFTVYVSNIT